MAAADDPERARHYLDSLHGVLEAGRLILLQGGSSLDAVEYCVALLEDDPLVNAGRGSVLNEDGEIEMDAGLMECEGGDRTTAEQRAIPSPEADPASRSSHAGLGGIAGEGLSP